MPPPKSEPLAPEEQIERSLTVLKISQLITPLTTQTYMSLTPLLLTIDMHRHASVYGWLLFLMTCGSMIAFMTMPLMFKYYSPRAILLADFVVRGVAGVLFSVAIFFDDESSATTRLVLIFISRFVYGLSLNSFALPFPWIGIRLPSFDRPKAIGMVTALLSLGIQLGPVIGNVFGTFAPHAPEWMLLGLSRHDFAFVLLGYWTVLASAFLFLLHWYRFTDDALLSEKWPKPDDADDAKPVVSKPVDAKPADAKSDDAAAPTPESTSAASEPKPPASDEPKPPAVSAAAPSGASKPEALRGSVYISGDGELGTKEEDEASKTEREAVLIANINLLNTFLMCAAYLAGFEATMSLQVYDAYGWDETTSWHAWIPFGVSAVIISVILTPMLLDALNPARLATGAMTCAVGVFFGVNWLNLKQPIPIWLFLLENVLGNGYGVLNALNMSVQSRKLPSHLQVKYGALVPMATQIGRATGPVLSTKMYEFGVWWLGPNAPGAGMNVSRIYMMAVGLPGFWVAYFGYFKLFYGSFDDLSPTQQREAKAGDNKAIV